MFIKKSAFALRVTNHEFEPASNITGLFQNAEGKDETCSAGFLCVRKEQMDLAGYPGKKNDNAWIMNAAADGMGDAIFACNTHEVNTVVDEVTGAEYKVGANTLGLPAPAGRPCTFTYIDFDSCIKQYRFGEGNLTAEIGESKYLVIENGILKPSAEAPTTAGQAYFEVIDQGNFVQGAYDSFKYISVLAKRVKAGSSAAAVVTPDEEAGE